MHLHFDDFDYFSFLCSGKISYSPFTIGWFYGQINASLVYLTNEKLINFTNTNRQITDYFGPGRLYVIDSLETAQRAISEIVEQGEVRTLSSIASLLVRVENTDLAHSQGKNSTDPLDPFNQTAHYYKFEEIVEGRRLVKDSDGGWSYSGPRIPFDPEGVYPMIDNPSVSFSGAVSP